MKFPSVLTTPWVARIVKAAFSLLAIGGVLWVAAWAAVPWLLRTGLEKAASEQLGRRLTLESIDFRPTSLQLTVHGLALADAHGQATQLRLDRLEVDVSWESLLRRAPVVDALHIAGLRLHLTHLGPGRYDVDDILQRRSKVTEPSGAPGAVPRFVLRNLNLQDAAIDLVDQPARKTHLVRDLSLAVPLLSTLDAAGRDTVTEPQLAFTLNGARFSATAQATPFASNRKTEAHVHLERLDLQPYLAYWSNALGWRPQAGSLAADLRLHFEQQGPVRLGLSGTVAADGVRLTGPRGEQLAVQSIHLGLTDAQPLAQAAQQLTLDLAEAHYTDATRASPVRIALHHLALQVGPWARQAGEPLPFSLKGQLGQIGAPLGQLVASGTMGMAPLAVHAEVEVLRLPLHAASAYLADVVNATVRHADASARGKFSYVRQADGAAVQFSGDAALDDVRLAPATGAEGGGVAREARLLSWKSLSLRGLDVALTPGQASRLVVAETALNDFDARIILNPQGRLNLQDLVKTGDAGTPSAPPHIRLGPISLLNGRVQFTDRFIQPNYTAQLSGLTGRLGGFSSDAPREMAELTLRGRAEGSAELDIHGRLNPLARPLALDIQGRVRDLELPPLSPYAIKYAGHGIERGKLAVDVSYLVRPDGQLEANNRLVLKQLTFGEAVEGAPTSLPVRLAVALLADRDGVIDVDLPIRGSLNDPEFSLGPVIFKAVMNLLTKAVTAPFNFLASLFGGNDEQGVVHFAPGSAVLQTERLSALDKMAEAMQQRPALILTLTGSASLAAEGDALRQRRLDDMLLAEKQRSAGAGAATLPPARDVAAAPMPSWPVSPTSGGGVVSPQERLALLREFYRRAQFPKPRNLQGQPQELSITEMEALLLASISINEEAMRQLAHARSAAVRDYLLSRGLPSDRLFLGAPKLVAESPSGWTPQVDMQLAAP